ncbi:hypothetical protein [Dyadobacter sp. 32]|uniref:hypothetical protein n=1 Tax=Dyadobacter sp. 32 TaxID=538966 RepID=UPI0011F03B76
MKNKKMKYLLSALSVLLVAYILYDSFSQPNTNDLNGDFKEVALYRNENNTGPIVRIYAVTVNGTPWEEMQKYGELMPYTKYGSTTVFFFAAGKPAPKDLMPGEVNFGKEFNPNCIARYEKDANGQVSFVQFPLKP